MERVKGAAGRQNMRSRTTRLAVPFISLLLVGAWGCGDQEGGLFGDDPATPGTPGTTTIGGVPSVPTNLSAVTVTGPTNDPTGSGIDYYEWAWDDGPLLTTSPPGGTATHTYAADGDYTITVTVHNIDGTIDTTTPAAMVTIDTTSPVVTIDEFVIEGTSNADAQVTVNTLAEDITPSNPAGENTTWEKNFVLDGGALLNSLPPDPGVGTSQTYTFDVEATNTGGNSTLAPHRVTITIEP